MTRIEKGIAKSFSCNFCQRKFARNEHLQRHVRTRKHIVMSMYRTHSTLTQPKDTKEKPFACPCGHTFTRLDLLKRHNRISHGGQPLSEQADETIPERHEVVSHSTPSSEEYSGPVQHPQAGFDHESERSPRDTSAQISARRYGNCTSVCASAVDVAQSVARLSPTDDSVDTSMRQIQQYGHLNPLQDFADFVDSIGLTLDSDGSNIFNFPFTVEEVAGVNNHIINTNNLDFTTTESHAQGVVSMPQLSPNHILSRDRAFLAVGASHPEVINNPASRQLSWTISEDRRESLKHLLEPFESILTGFALPSHYTLSRYYKSFVDQFHKHYPLVHIPTLRVDYTPPELALIIAAIGAQYRFESRNGLALYKASKAIALEKIRKQDLAGDCHTSPLSPMPPTLADGPDLTSQQQRIDMIRTLVMLIAFSSWDWKSELLRDAFGLQSILARCLREDGMHEDLSASDQNWYDWILIEGARRVKMIAFAYLNVQTVAYNLPPVMLNNEVELQMPCSTAEWDAPDAIEWQLTRARSRHPDLGFQDALHAFLSRTQVSEVQSLLSRLSPLANFILLQALIQRTCLLRQLSITAGAALRKDDLDEMEDALRRWKNVWQRAPGSTLDPQNPDGPLPFTSVAFFTLASVRLHLDLGSYRRLDTRDPAQIATALIGVPALKRGPHLTTALLHVTHALSLPVNMGVQYVSRSQMFFWSCQHSLCGLESAVFLSKWLRTVAETLDEEPLTAHEIIILDWVRALVEETRESVDLEELGVRSNLEISALQPSQLCTIVLRIWARVFGGNTMWAIISQIGSALEQLAERIERENMRLAQ
ncbi:hypothetical protein D6C79_00269 [Aureobasidium pullulans]|nr:hypothetical protein D6C79_00269 [Aureobasidium pullulans]